MRFIKKLDLIIPILILVYATIYFVEVSFLPNDIDLLLIRPVFYILALTIIIYLGLQLYNYRKGKIVENDEENEVEFDKKKALYFSVLTIVYVFLLDYIGFIVGTLLYMMTLMYFLGVRNLKVIILTSASLVAFIFISLDILLNIKLPQGILLVIGVIL